MEILQNETPVNFTTSDEPIINICANYENPLGENIKDLEFYYLVTPKIAIMCKSGSSKNQKTEIDVEDKIQNLNLIMFKAASRQVYVLHEKDLQRIKKNER